MLPTPDTSHVSFSTIYEPAEDSYFFLDTLSSTTETAWLTSHFSNRSHSSPSSTVPLAVEIGTGSGIIIAFLAAHAQTILGSAVVALGVDANIHACVATWRTVEKAVGEQCAATGGAGSVHSVYADSIAGDLSGMLKPHSVDLLVCNPPYVPSETVPELPSNKFSSSTDPSALESEPATNLPKSYASRFEHESHLLRLTYDGGTDGMQVTNRLLQQLRRVLSLRGVAYILLCARNRPEEVKEQIRGWEDGTWRAETAGRSGRKAGWERLEILRIWRDGAIPAKE